MSFKKIGVLGGGQLGRMLQEVAQRWNMPVYCMDDSENAPAALYRDFYTMGNIRDYHDVLAFGQDKDVITIEIEHVNLEALIALEKQGKEIHPNPRALKIIKNKNRQKNYYKDNNIPIPRFMDFNDLREALEEFPNWPYELPCIYKAAEMGYDGRGVRTMYHLDNVHDLENLPGAFEEKIDIKVEVAVMLAANPSGEIVIYPPVSMHFDEEDHILSEVYYPGETDQELTDQMNEIAMTIMKDLKICGLCAFEFFISKDNKVLLNEIAPRPHNSMHLSMDNAITSQFEQHLRGISDLPLGTTVMEKPAIMYNILGAEGDKGKASWQGWETILSLPGAKVHLYGKTDIKPARKMGHINITGDKPQELKDKLEIIKAHFKHNSNG